MNSQTRSVLKAALIGLAISIALAAAHAGQEGRVNPIDPYQIFNPEVIARWVGRLGSIPLIFIVGVIVMSFRKTALWVSALNLVGAIAGISLAITVGVVALAAAYPVKDFPFATAGADRDDFVKDGMTACIRRQHGLPQNASLSDTVIYTFCSCYVNAAADVTTRDDIQYQAKYGTMSADEKEKLTASYEKCSKSAARAAH
jgi:hypothetical protein